MGRQQGFEDGAGSEEVAPSVPGTFVGKRLMLGDDCGDRRFFARAAAAGRGA